MNVRKKIMLYDTTLRDGAQGQGISFSLAGKISLALKLDAFGIDYIEGGYAGSNARDMAFFRQIREAGLKHARVVAFGSTRRARRCVEDDPLVQSLLDAQTPAVAIVGKTSRLHVKDVLKASAKENLSMIGETVRFLKAAGREVFFDAEHFFDGYREDPGFTMEAMQAAVDAGADCLVLCDTNGGCLPDEIERMTRAVVERMPVPVAIHAHDDTGVAVANALAAVRAGASQVQGTINGFGERCGNANLTTMIPNLQLKMGYACVPARSLKRLYELSHFADDLVNLRSNNKAPYVGQDAFAHMAGLHVNAVQKNPKTYEHESPERVGNRRRILMSELSGQSSVLLKAIELGMGRQESVDGVKEILGALKSMESRGYAFEAADASFKMLIQKVLKKHKSFFDLEGFRVIVEKRGKEAPCLTEATIKVRVKDEVEQTVAEGDGPVNALDGALRKALVRFYPEIAKVFLTDFRVRILDPEEATAATTRVLIESSDGRESWGTVGVSENIIEASWEALVDSVEYKLFREEEKRRQSGATSRKHLRKTS
jgi:2-isopropylmalate synthase